nr:PREDICTED: adenylate cyclase type 10-like [Megachile rotundata]
MYSDEEKTAWTPDIVGPIYKSDNITLREVLISHRDDKCTRVMATFVPDELIYEPDLTKKNFRKFNSVIALIDVTRLFGVYEKYIMASYGGSMALFQLLNRYISIIIIEVYSTHGDVIKFSQDGLLVIWKVNRNEYVSRMVYNVILCGQRIQETVTGLEDKALVPKVACGEVTFSVIGNESARHYVVGGSPIEALQYARKICLPGDLVLSSSAWEFCAPSQYEYVIKDSSNVKIIKVLGPPVEVPEKHVVIIDEQQEPSITTERLSDVISISESSSHSNVEGFLDFNVYLARISVIDAYRRRLGSFLRTYMLKPVLTEVDSGESLEYLTETRKITAVAVNIVPSKSSIYELISLVDELFKIIMRNEFLFCCSVIEQYFGCIATVNFYDRDILFNLMYGVREYSTWAENEPNAEYALHSALQIMNNAKCVPGVKAISIGVSTGMAFCGVVGHIVRRQYMIFGTPIDKAISLMKISYGKISCDYEAYADSSLSKNNFRSRGMKTLSRFGRCFVYEYIEAYTKDESRSNLEYCYPILDRFQEIEYFKDIMDDIGVEGRSYSGMLIEVWLGAERSGKSRLLDAFVTIVRNRQIQVIALHLHRSYTEKAYAVLHHVFLQLFDASECTTIYDREKAIGNKLSDILKPEDFCYLNCIMRVQFPLSKSYCEETDWKRHTKTIEIFEKVLQKISGRVCILLDDVQHMDLLSWQFFAVTLNNINVVLVMTLQEPLSWDDLTQVEAAICQDKRLMNRTLLGIDSKYVAAFACQFLNVSAVPKSLERVLQKRGKTTIGWCETFLISTLQVHALTFMTITPSQAKKYDLVFPESSMLVKIPAYLTPEEVAPPLHWTQMSSLNVCITSDRPIGFIASNRDITDFVLKEDKCIIIWLKIIDDFVNRLSGLRIDIYNRMNSYEQDFIKCASVIGAVFLRHTVESVMVNSAPLYTSTAVAEMIKLRILQCALIQRKYFHSDDSVYYLFKKHKTFSNMHHLVTCDCQSSRSMMDKSLPPYADCKVLEFTINSYRKLLYDILPPHEKEDYHTRAVTYFEREARRCSTCGGGSFFSLFATEEATQLSEESIPATSTMLHRKISSWNRSERFRIESRRSIFIAENDADKKRDNRIRRISILPAHSDDEDYIKDLPSYMKKQRQDQSFLKPSFFNLWERRLKDFTYINYRNCRCNEVINFVFWKLHYHVERSRDIDKLTKCMIEYTAGLILTAQPLFAIKFLTSANANIEALKKKEHLVLEVPNWITDRGKILILMGDGYLAYGNYSQARKFYTEAVSLRIQSFHSGKAVCYKTVIESVKRRLHGFPAYNLGKITGKQALHNLEVAVYLHRLAVVYMFEREAKVAKVTILDSIRAAFESAGGFIQKGIIYLTALQIFRQFEGQEFIEPLEKLMSVVIEETAQWRTPEAFVVAAKIFVTMYNTRILQGKIKETIQIGIKICKICTTLHVTHIKLTVLPSLIELMLWTKRLNEAADLLKELYYTAKEDTDYSAITWYYALCLQCSLDASMVVESYETCSRFYQSFFNSKSRSCVLRDPQSLCRLTTCLAIWQLRMRMVVNEILVLDVEEYTEGIDAVDITINGGQVDITINGGQVDISINGGQMDITINGGQVDITINDGQVDIIINGGQVDTTINGGQMDITINGGQVDIIINGGPVDITINGGQVDIIINGGPVDININDGQMGITINGGQADIIINGGQVDIIINGGQMDITINGGQVDIIINGGQVDIIINGGPVDITINGGQVDITINGRQIEISINGGQVDITINDGQVDISINGGPALECYLLILKRRITIKKSSDLFDRVQNVQTIIKTLRDVADQAKFVYPFLYFMEAYMELLRGRKGSAQNYLNKAHKWAAHQQNKFMLAWIEQNKRTWKEANYNNMAQYWAEHVGAEDAIRWQEIHKFGVSAWSTILFPLPVPDSNI